MAFVENGHKGLWHCGDAPHLFDSASADQALAHLDAPVYVLQDKGETKYAVGGAVCASGDLGAATPIRATAPPCAPEFLGDPAFCRAHGLKYPCYAGSMAHGIASMEMVEAMGRAGMLGFFGSAGVSHHTLRETIKHLHNRMLGKPFGFNLINSPDDAAWERDAVALFLEHGVRLVEASAYIFPTLPLVKYRVTGLHQDATGSIDAPNSIIAKVSRSETARRFMEPPPEKLLKKLLETGEITREEARLAKFIPLAQDITAEADSGGHTDHRAALAVLPTLQRLRDEIQREHDYPEPVRVGLAGGIGTPHAAAAAFAMGAAYVVTGSVNQSCVESGTSDMARALLSQATQTDTADAPSADMFEMGVTVQVLKKGTRFAQRAAKLYELYRRYESVEAIPAPERESMEKHVFRQSLEEIWEQTAAYFAERNPRQLEKAEENPKHKLALICRWYLGNAAHWANRGVTERNEDFQIWCGPAMGAFNDWARGSFLEKPANRRVAVIAKQLLYGAALLLRVQLLRAQGIDISMDAAWIAPRPDIA